MKHKDIFEFPFNSQHYDGKDSWGTRPVYPVQPSRPGPQQPWYWLFLSTNSVPQWLKSRYTCTRMFTHTNTHTCTLTVTHALQKHMAFALCEVTCLAALHCSISLGFVAQGKADLCAWSRYQCQGQVSVGCNYLSLPLIPVSGTQVLICKM